MTAARWGTAVSAHAARASEWGLQIWGQSAVWFFWTHYYLADSKSLDEVRSAELSVGVRIQAVCVGSFDRDPASAWSGKRDVPPDTWPSAVHTLIISLFPAD